MVAIANLESTAALTDFRGKLRASPLRPVLCHLNADTSWLLSLAYPATNKSHPYRTRFNILIDPWFTGAQSDVASWFSTQYHAISSSVQSIATLNAILADAENALLPESPSSADTPSPYHIDAVIVSHEFTDHCHKATLLELPSSVPIFSTTKAVELIRSWNHFTAVIDVPSLTKSTDWRTTSTTPLPPWVGISRLITQGNSLYYHSAIIICVPKISNTANNNDDDPPDHAAEAIIYTPHGVESCTFAQIAAATPPIETLAFLHGLHDVSITLTKQLNLGAHNAFKAQKLLKPKYWVGTHDEVKRGLGLIGPLLRRKAWTIEDAIAQDRKTARKSQSRSGSGGAAAATTATTGAVKDDTTVPFVQCGNGQSIVLD